MNSHEYGLTKGASLQERVSVMAAGDYRCSGADTKLSSRPISVARRVYLPSSDAFNGFSVATKPRHYGHQLRKQKL